MLKTFGMLRQPKDKKVKLMMTPKTNALFSRLIPTLTSKNYVKIVLLGVVLS